MDFRLSPPPESPSGAQSIGRAAAVLRLLAQSGGDGASLSMIVPALGLTKPTTRRILLALIEAGLVAQDGPSRRYGLGPQSYRLGAAAAHRYGLEQYALDCVRRLAERTGDAAFLQIRQGSFVLCVAREDGSYPLRSHVLKAGDRHPLGAGAGPLAILAALSDTEVEAALATHAALYAQSYPMLTADTLRALVADSRARGYSLNAGLLFPGSWGMGVALSGVSGEVEGCLSLAAVESRMQPSRQAELYGWLTEEAMLVARRIAAVTSPAQGSHP